eukprot:6480202-Pyramimonas_sp.AAC.1
MFSGESTINGVCVFCPAPEKKAVKPTNIVRMRDKGARALDAHFEASRAGRGQQKQPRMDRGGNDARVSLRRLPILTTRVEHLMYCTLRKSRAFA